MHKDLAVSLLVTTPKALLLMAWTLNATGMNKMGPTLGTIV